MVISSSNQVTSPAVGGFGSSPIYYHTIISLPDVDCARNQCAFACSWENVPRVPCIYPLMEHCCGTRFPQQACGLGGSLRADVPLFQVFQVV